MKVSNAYMTRTVDKLHTRLSITAERLRRGIRQTHEHDPRTAYLSHSRGGTSGTQSRVTVHCERAQTSLSDHGYIVRQYMHSQ